MPNALGSVVKVKASLASLEPGPLLGLGGGGGSGGHWPWKRSGAHRPGPLSGERLVPPPAMTEVGGRWPCLTQSQKAFGPGLEGTLDESGRRTPDDLLSRTRQSFDLLDSLSEGLRHPAQD